MKLFDRPNVAWGAALAAAVLAVAGLFLTFWFHYQDPQAALDRQQDAFCGLVQPIGEQPIGPRTSELSRTLIFAARHTTAVLHCPPADGK